MHKFYSALTALPALLLVFGLAGALPTASSFSGVTAAIMQAHAPILDYLYHGVGLEAVVRQSQILIDVLSKLA